MAKSRIGPFSLEVPLSNQKSSGQVFRGIHLEQRKLAALRVFTVPMGLTPESRRDFAGQLEHLKQMRHRGIVRCYGGGFDTRAAYLAYELVDGESLDTILERRERLPWETALDYSQQIAEALQYAHQMGWVHGRLKPDKVLVSTDGSVKICDWRRDAFSSTFSGSTLAPETLQYSAPEIFDGQPADEKSDLYSVGVLMYTMLTGKPPFSGDPESLKQMVLSTPAPAVSASVLDCPVWLSAIVDQSLSKEPKHRPFSATALQLAFKEAQRRQAEGVGVLQHATAGFSPLRMNVDRDEAEKVLGIKPKKRRKTDDTPFFERTWVLLSALLIAIAAIVWFTLPLSEESLRTRALALLPPSSQQWTDWNKARDDFLLQIVRRFPDGANSEWAQERVAWVNARETERRLERESRTNRDTTWTDPERQFWKAREFEEFGDALTAMDRYRALVGLYGNNDEAKNEVFLANEAIQRIREQGLTSTRLQDFISKKLDDASQAYKSARIVEAREKWEWIVELYSGNAEVSSLVEEAQSRLDELKNRSGSR